MDRRTKILAIGFLAIIGYAAIAKLVYPKWIHPLMTYDKRIADRQSELDKLLEVAKEVDKGRFEYKGYVERLGSFDIVKVENALRQQLNTLIELHGLKDASVTPSRKNEDRKTKIWKMTLTVQAEGPLQGVAGLMKDVAELPQLIRFGSVTITPGQSTLKGGRPTLHEQVSIRLPIELWVLPPNRTVGPLDEATLAEAEPVIRHQQRDYALLWAGRPFSDYIEPQELVADAGEDQNLPKPGRSLALRGSVKGGIGEYTIQWSPSTGVQNPTNPITKVDTSQPGEFVYTLTVTDETGATSSDDVTITIAEDRTPVTQRIEPQRPPPDPRDKRWQDGRYMQLVMMLGRTYNGQVANELMVFDRKAKQTSYFAPGDDFDGGKLIFVHQTGGLVHRKDGYYVYPIGVQLDQDLKLEDAEMFFELQAAAVRDRASVAQEDQAKVAAEGATPEAGADHDALVPDAGKDKAPEAGEAKGATEAVEQQSKVTTPVPSGEAEQGPDVPGTTPGSAQSRKKWSRPDVRRPKPIGRKPR